MQVTSIIFFENSCSSCLILLAFDLQSSREFRSNRKVFIAFYSKCEQQLRSQVKLSIRQMGIVICVRQLLQEMQNSKVKAEVGSSQEVSCCIQRYASSSCDVIVTLLYQPRYSVGLLVDVKSRILLQKQQLDFPKHLPWYRALERTLQLRFCVDTTRTTTTVYRL